MAGTTALIVLCTSITAAAAEPSPVVSGELKQWHRVTITFTGPDSGESVSIETRVRVAGAL